MTKTKKSILITDKSVHKLEINTYKYSTDNSTARIFWARLYRAIGGLNLSNMAEIMIRGHGWANSVSSQLISMSKGWICLSLIEASLNQSLKNLIPTPILTRRNISTSNKPIFYE